MEDPRQALKEVWRLFRNIGVTDDLTIVEHIAAVLLTLRGMVAPTGVVAPRQYEGPEMGTDTYASILAAIQQAVETLGDDATVLDPSALFRPADYKSTGRYPTPRHIVASMLALARVLPSHSLADFACGSGGFLALRPRDPSGSSPTVGVEIASQWAAIAWANAALRLGPQQLIVYAQNSLLALAPNGALHGAKFNHVLTNPPFGEKIDETVATALGGQYFGGRSETAIAALSLAALKDGGTAAILLPAGPLFSNGAGERELRRRMVEDHSLLAVAALPKDALQPFSSVQTYLALVAEPKGQSDRTWFFRLTKDGYPAGQGRDLTRPPSAPSDIPLLEGVMGVQDELAVGDLTGAADGIESAAYLGWTVAGELRTGGMRIRAEADARIERLEWFAPGSTDGTDTVAFLASVESAGITRLFELSPVIGSISLVTDRTLWIERRYGDDAASAFSVDAPSQNSLTRTAYVGADVAVELIVSLDGDLFARSVPNAVLKQARDLRPETHVPFVRHSQVAQATATIIADIRRNQRAIGRQLHELSAAAEPSSRDAARPVAFPFPDSAHLLPYGLLSLEQDEVYRAVLAKVSQRSGPSGDYIGPDPFTALQISRELNAVRPSVDALGRPVPPYTVGFVDQTLSVFEALGVVMRASIPADAEGLPPLRYFRVATRWDVPA